MKKLIKILTPKRLHYILEKPCTKQEEDLVDAALIIGAKAGFLAGLLLSIILVILIKILVSTT